MSNSRPAKRFWTAVLLAWSGSVACALVASQAALHGIVDPGEGEEHVGRNMLLLLALFPAASALAGAALARLDRICHNLPRIFVAGSGLSLLFAFLDTPPNWRVPLFFAVAAIVLVGILDLCGRGIRAIRERTRIRAESL